MAGVDFHLSGLVVILTVVLIVVGLVILFFWYFKRADNLTNEDRLNIERSKVAWIGAIALGILILVSMKKERGGGKMGMSLSMGRRSASSLL